MSRSSNRVRERREALVFAQLTLAEQAGITRQSLFAIERGRSDPSVAVALRIATALSSTVEDLFADPGAGAALVAELGSSPASSPAAASDRVPDSASPFAAVASPARVALARLGGRWVAHPLEPDEPPHAADGVVWLRAGCTAGERVEVSLLRSADGFAFRAGCGGSSIAGARPDTVVLAGCAPPLGVLADRVGRTRGAPRALWLDRGNAPALAALGARRVSLAGVHGGAREDTEVIPTLGAMLGRVRPASGEPFVVVALARWRAGIVVAPGNPLGIRDASDLARADVRFVRREAGSGARALIERELRRASLEPVEVLSRARETRGHLAVARAVALGAADAGVAIEPAALALGLAFVPLEDERFDLVMPAGAEDEPALRRVLDVLASRSFRADVGALGGYDVTRSGDRVGTLV